MGTFLADVLSSCEKVEMKQINVKCPEIAVSVETNKSELLSYLEDVYVRFMERPRRNKILAAKINQLQEDITVLLDIVKEKTEKDLAKSEKDLDKHLSSLNEAEITISLLSVVLQIHESLVKIKQLRNDECFLECIKEIFTTEKLIDGLEIEENLSVISEMSVLLSTEKNLLLNTLSNIFKDNVIVNSGENRNVIKLRNESELLEKDLRALYYYKTSVSSLDSITRFLWNHIFVPVVDMITRVEINSEGDFATLELVIVNANKKSSYDEVFTNIKSILAFLSANFNISLTEEISTLSYIGRDIRDNLSELIIKHCLQDTIPSTNEGLQRYKIVIEATKDLEKMLVMSKIFAEDTTSILDYANNIDVLFINKKCQDYVIAAQELMKKDLHDIVEVGDPQPVTGLEATEGFPHCSVSRSVIDLLNLLEKILAQAETSSEICSGRLFCAVKTICQKYGIIVPEHHKKLLQTIPQQIALFYNNCMYISYKLCEWNNTCLTKLPSVLNIGAKSFIDEGRQLREIASEKFTSYVDSQVKQIEEIMKESGLQKQTLEQLEPSTDKCVRQCLRQQELLRTVWHKVLPYTSYNTTLGTILDSLCECLINSVVKFEDISSDAAEQLVELFKMVQTRGPKLFTDPKEVNLFVTNWYKLNELTFVLNASLLDINDRWADGKGPLGLQFKAEELKQLIRALFQNTERRAALLTKIHD